MKHFSSAACAILAAAALLSFSPSASTAAGGSISGTAKVTGASSSADVVVYVQNAAGTFTPKAATMDQRNMQFIPHVLPVVAGTEVKFNNDDPTAHNVFSPDGEKFNLGTWPKGQSKDYAFSKCAKFPCVYTLLCRVHPEMVGYVVVVQNPYFAVTDKEGHYTINDVPPGNYTLAVWHEKGKAQPKPVTVDAGKPATVDFQVAR